MSQYWMIVRYDNTNDIMVNFILYHDSPPDGFPDGETRYDTQ